MRHIESPALLVRSVAYGESDVIVTLITETHGKVSALVRGGRKSSRRVGGALEPLHTIEVKLDDRGGDLATLREAKILRVRAKVATDLEALDAAGTMLRWARHLFPARHAEPRAYATTEALLDALEKGRGSPRAALAEAALRLLGDVGYGLDFDQCVKCGKACPPTRSAFIDPSRGGLVCRTCGGARRVIAADVRSVGRKIHRGEAHEMTAEEAEELLAIADEAMAAHTGFEPGSGGR